MHAKHGKMTALEDAKENTRLLLERMHSRGVALFVDGRAVLPGVAAARTVREDSPYMADYVLGDTGNIEQIRFDKVSND